LKQILVPRRHFLAAMLTALALPALAADGERRVPVSLEAGVARSFDDEISDYEVVVYVVPLRQGQVLQVALTSSNASNCFDIYAPGADKPAYVGSESGSRARWTAAAGGDYLVKVYLLRLAARDGQMAHYALELKLAA
jgi:hypothetical protein